MIFSPLDLASLSVMLFLLQGLLAPFFRKNERVMVNVCFSLASAASLLAIAAGICTVGNGTIHRAILALGLPDLPFH
ncbi:MAG TPA: hypothetical protein DD713_03660, partial [Nitrospiraceae bacterium]|nr:hypothetical protein [Nitrospiraceae bacterium]